MVEQMVETKRVPGLAVLAAAGVVLVGYSYLFGLWTSRYQESPELLVVIRGWVNQTTGIGEDFGFLGVALLLLVAGYAISETASKLTARQLVVRLGRTAAPVVVGAVLVSTVLVLLGATPLTDPANAELSFAAVVTNLLLLPRFFGQQSFLALDVPVTATVLFVLLILAVRPLRRHPVIAMVVQLEIVGGLILLGGWANESGSPTALHALGLIAGYLPLLLIGELAWSFRTGALNARFGVGFGFAGVVLLVVHDRLFPELGGWWHPLSAIYAVLFMLIALPRGAAIAVLDPVRWLASRALPLFFSILVVGYAALGLQRGWVPLVLAIQVALMLSGLCAEGAHRAVRRLS
ncbi:hypothetical protein ACFOWZ_14805 [Lentzea rhizosphaerae]|uniref:Uncharacterized protein n=1 Tax=Lentzea rhizosphaerae TaxID=2041025 RepID=A0ABV8BTR5_9PSEU